MKQKGKAFTVLAVVCLFLFIFSMAPELRSDEFIEARKLSIVPKSFNSIVTYSKKATKGSSWTEFRLEFSSKVEWVDELTVKYFVLVASAKESSILSGDITYINVPAGKSHLSSIFIHPTAMAKYGKVIAVHCEIWANGQLRDAADSPSKPAKKWWDVKPPVQGLLVSKFFTPFSMEGEYDGLAIKAQ
jgi:hypothetical protein